MGEKTFELGPISNQLETIRNTLATTYFTHIFIRICTNLFRFAITFGAASGTETRSSFRNKTLFSRVLVIFIAFAHSQRTATGLSLIRSDTEEKGSD